MQKAGDHRLHRRVARAGRTMERLFFASFLRAFVVNVFCLFIGTASTAVAAETVAVPLPPVSLAQWYKPVNERQVWLHTMFGLREAMQAVEEYAAAGDHAAAARWAGRFAELYAKVPTMVPEWADEVEPEQAEALVAAAGRGDGAAVATALHRLGTSCDGCHGDFQAVAAALYRSPDYRRVTVADADGAVAYPEAMVRLSRALNRVKIAMKDADPARTRSAIGELKGRLEALKGSCAGCHREAAPVARILGPDSERLLDELAAAADARSQGRLLGEIGVGVCARCHATHRTLAGLRRLVAPRVPVGIERRPTE